MPPALAIAPRRCIDRRMRSQKWSLTAVIRNALGRGVVVASLGLPALAADLTSGTDAVDGRIKVIVTGSNIPTIERETALPVQIITRVEIERANIQTAAQLVNTISATMSYSAFNEAQALGGQNGGIGQAGFAGAALRGLGYQATLVLLNGRRIANWAFTTIGGDLNAIPMAAVERVEVLTNGASAIYGSDAVAGVINFIMRKDFQGAEAYAQYTSPEHTGGYAKHFTFAGGYGDLASQRFNAYAMVDYQQFGGIAARDRPFAARNYIPEEGVDRTSINSFPANADTPAGVRNPTGDPARQYANPSCAPPLSFPTAGSANQYQCRWNGDGSPTIFNPSERLNVAGMFTWQLDQDNQLFLYSTFDRNQSEFSILPTQVSSQTTFQQNRRFLLPADSPFYPHDFARTFSIDGTREATVVAYSNVYIPIPDYENSGWGNPPKNLWLPPRFLPVDGGTLAIEGMDVWTFGPLPPDGSTLNRNGTIVPLWEFDRMILRLMVREYHHAGMDHYLLTANAAEFDALDSGDVPGWQPMGVTFWAWAKKASQQFVPVCRLLFLYPSGYSHFMSNFANECAALASSGAAILETSDAFYMAASDGASCPNMEITYFGARYYYGTSGLPIYRLWNGKAEANHRYVIDIAARDAMVARGWVSEGSGPEGVVMCGYVSTEFN